MAEDNQHNLFRFERDLEAFSRQMDIELTTVVKKVGLDLFRRIVVKTPVDTGRARASWTIAIGEPDRSVAEPGQYDEYQTGADAQAQTTADRVLARYDARTYEPVWISNNLPYIEALEHGHSQQAPNGMVALSIAETELELETAMRAAA